MRKLAMALGITFALTAQAEQPFKLPLDNPFERITPMPVVPLNRPAMERNTAIFIRRTNPCYFIRQANRNIQTPLAKPQLVPLAASTATLLSPGESDCTNRPIGQATSR